MKLLYIPESVIDKEIAYYNLMAKESLLSAGMSRQMATLLRHFKSQMKDCEEIWDKCRKSKYVIEPYFEINSYDDYLTQLETLKNQTTP